MAIIHAPSTLPAPVAVPVASPAPPITLLLAEPQFLLRRTVAAVARDMRLADPQEVTTIEAAARLLSFQPFDALFLSLDDAGEAIELMSLVRNGDTKCDRLTPMAVMAAACDTALALRLKQLEVRRLLLRPFKVKGVLDAIVALRQAPAPRHAPIDKAA
jgi:hypothetical protein